MWSRVNPYLGATLTVSREQVTIQHADASSCTADDFREGALHRQVMALFDVETLTEAHGWLLEGTWPEQRRVVPTDHTPLEGRPTVSRAFTHQRRVPIWFFGRTIALDLPDTPRQEIPMATVAAHGLDGFRRALGSDLVRRAVAAARALDPLPCFCGTGCTRSHEHDALDHLVSHQHPLATMVHRASLYRCRVCGRWWTYTEAGDTHYSFHYDVRQFKPYVSD
jgi:hypothetical protein